MPCASASDLSAYVNAFLHCSQPYENNPPKGQMAKSRHDKLHDPQLYRLTQASTTNDMEAADQNVSQWTRCGLRVFSE